MIPLADTANALRGKVKAVEEKLSSKLSALLSTGEKLTDAASNVEESWSGSALGYHSELHYGIFERPPLQARFDPEWGGIHGLPAGWESRTPDEVKERIEQLAGTAFTDLETGTSEVVAEAQALQSEIVTEVSALHGRAGVEREKELLTELEHFKWGKTIGDYMKGNLSTGFMSRDSRAVAQGVRVPAHLYYKAVVFQSETQCTAVREFFGLAGRLLRQIELNAPSGDVANDADQLPVKAVIAICDRFHNVARQLLHRRQNRPTLEITDE
jgi:hypothetical protein